MKKVKLTKQDIFEYIKTSIEKTGYGPTRRDMYFNLDTGYRHLDVCLKWLKEDGKIISVGFPKRYCILKNG